jgi:hypothetical protein
MWKNNWNSDRCSLTTMVWVFARNFHHIRILKRKVILHHTK